MAQPPVNLANLSAQARADFKTLTSTPSIAWPTMILWAVVTVVMIASDVLAVTDRIPLWAGMLINAMVGYLAFSVVHDTIHRTATSNTALNDAVGQAAVMLFAPYVSHKLFRWGHILHHRFASGPKDPDVILHGAWWSLPFRWMFIDALYFRHVLLHGDKVAHQHLRQSLWMIVASLALGAYLIYAGYGTELLMLWFIPSRLVFLLLGFTFFWLPHVPHDTTQEENFTKATTIRLGNEWLMRPLLQYQNFHLIHHLYPMTPFYNNEKVWRLLESELRKKDLAIQYGFSIHPTIHPAPKGA